MTLVGLLRIAIKRAAAASELQRKKEKQTEKFVGYLKFFLAVGTVLPVLGHMYFFGRDASKTQSTKSNEIPCIGWMVVVGCFASGIYTLSKEDKTDSNASDVMSELTPDSVVSTKTLTKRQSSRRSLKGGKRKSKSHS